DSRSDRGGGLINVDALSADKKFAALSAGMRAEDGHHQFTAARTHETGNPENLPSANAETHVVHEQFSRHIRIFDGDSSRLENNCVGGVMRVRENVGNFAADHSGNHALRVER